MLVEELSLPLPSLMLERGELPSGQADELRARYEILPMCANDDLEL